MYKIIKTEEYHFDTLREAIDKKNSDFYCDSNVRIMEFDNYGDEERLVMDGDLMDFQWFKDFMDDFEGNIYIRSYKNPVIVKVLHDRIEFLTNDEDEEVFGGRMIQKGKTIFKIKDNSRIRPLGYNEYKIWTGAYAIDVTFI